jgi:DNA (cytosine-5)-methyltransferase 1
VKPFIPAHGAGKRTRNRVGDLHLLVGGPPCQGHSDLNNHTRGDDPKNALCAWMARAAEALLPQIVLIENVLTLRNEISDVVGTTRPHLEAKKFVVAGATVSLHALGVAQRRQPHVMLASRNPQVDPLAILKSLTESPRWAERGSDRDNQRHVRASGPRGSSAGPRLAPPSPT